MHTRFLSGAALDVESDNLVSMLCEFSKMGQTGKPESN